MDGMTNLITFQGRLGKNPRTNTSESGRQCFFELASTNARGETCWVDVAIFQRFEAAMEVAETLKKGDLVSVYGSLQTRTVAEMIADVDPNTGEVRSASRQNRTKHSIIADVVEKDEDAAREVEESSKELLVARLKIAA